MHALGFIALTRRAVLFRITWTLRRPSSLRAQGRSTFPALPRMITPLSDPETLESAASFRVIIGQRERVVTIRASTKGPSVLMFLLVRRLAQYL